LLKNARGGKGQALKSKVPHDLRCRRGWAEKENKNVEGLGVLDSSLGGGEHKR